MSKTVKFEIGDRVLTIIDSKMYKGTIKRLHLDLPRPVAIIDLDDGTTGKFYITDIIPEPKESKEVKEEPEKVQEEPEKIPGVPDEKAEVTITYGQLRNLNIDTAMKMTKNTNDLLNFVGFGAVVCRRLFETLGND